MNKRNFMKVRTWQHTEFGLFIPHSFFRQKPILIEILIVIVASLFPNFILGLSPYLSISFPLITGIRSLTLTLFKHRQSDSCFGQNSFKCTQRTFYLEPNLITLKLKPCPGVSQLIQIHGTPYV